SSAANDGGARTSPAAPARAALVRNRRRLWIGMEHLPDPNSWISMSLARWPIRAVRIEASASLGPRIADHDMPLKVRGRGPSTPTDPQIRTYAIEGCAQLAAAQDSDGSPVRMSAKDRIAGRRRNPANANGRSRRVSPVAPRHREGPLTEPRAGAQPRAQECVL